MIPGELPSLKASDGRDLSYPTPHPKVDNSSGRRNGDQEQLFASNRLSPDLETGKQSMTDTRPADDEKDSHLASSSRLECFPR